MTITNENNETHQAEQREQCYVYILQGKLNHYYCGLTNNVNKRLLEHNSGKSISTRKNRPYTVKYCQVCNDRKHARRIEKKIKGQGVKRFLDKFRYSQQPTAKQPT